MVVITALILCGFFLLSLKKALLVYVEWLRWMEQLPFALQDINPLLPIIAVSGLVVRFRDLAG
ncbi:hypothetical protein [Nostoc sp.]|uniref:hypothetical protein n=1 Tax=Nostoc sp. TaxID=1180 RepID=UPI002FFC5F1E